MVNICLPFVYNLVNFRLWRPSPIWNTAKNNYLEIYGKHLFTFCVQFSQL